MYVRLYICISVATGTTAVLRQMVRECVNQPVRDGSDPRTKPHATSLGSLNHTIPRTVSDALQSDRQRGPCSQAGRWIVQKSIVLEAATPKCRRRLWQIGRSPQQIPTAIPYIGIR